MLSVVQLKEKRTGNEETLSLEEHSTMTLQQNEAISHLHTKKDHQNMTCCSSKRDLPSEMLNGETCFSGDEILLLGFEGHKIVFFFFLADAEDYTNILFLSCLHSEIPHVCVCVHGVRKVF